jgi:hypothetical protein
MWRTRVFFVVSALVWLPYGLFCLVRPDFLGGAAGVAIGSSTGRTEVRAMYGGLQAALGALVVLGMVDRRRERGVLTVLAMVCGGLFSARMVGVLLDGGVGSYTVSALVFEGGSTCAALALLRSRS